MAQGLPLDAAFQKFAPARKLPDDRPPLASLIPAPPRAAGAEAPAEVLLGLQVIRDTIHKHDEITQNRWARFRSQLASGHLRAAGYAQPRAPGDTPCLIPDEIWMRAAIDLSLSTLTVDGQAFEGLRVLRAIGRKRRAD